MHKPFHRLLAALAERTGQPALKASADDVCQILVDGLPLTLQYLPEDDAVLFFSVLGELPRTNREDFCLKLLEANHFFSGTDGATLSAHRSSGLVALHLAAPLARLDEARFLQIMESYLNTAERWAGACSRAEETRAARDKDASPDSGWVKI